jgi:phage gp36-like protein
MPAPAGRYVDLAFLQRFWGVRQVDAWADTDADGVRGEADEAAIQSAIEDAEDDVDGYLAGSHAVPFAAPAPRMIAKIARLRAGVYLYARRGLRDGADLAGQMRGWLDLSDRLLADIASGRIRLPGVARRSSSAVGTPPSAEDRVFTRESLGF